jgi:hypothetical protein
MSWNLVIVAGGAEGIEDDQCAGRDAIAHGGLCSPIAAYQESEKRVKDEDGGLPGEIVGDGIAVHGI